MELPPQPPDRPHGGYRPATDRLADRQLLRWYSSYYVLETLGIQLSTVKGALGLVTVSVGRRGSQEPGQL